MYRPEAYELRYLERGLELSSSEIVHGMCMAGWQVGEATLCRLRTGSIVNIDVAGLPFYAIGRLFPTVSGIAVMAQTAIWLNRLALSNKLTKNALEDVLSEAKELIYQAENRYALMRVPADEEAKDDQALDLAAIAEAKGQLAATQNNHRAALDHFLNAYSRLLPVARKPGCQLGVIVGLGRALAAALNEAFDCDEAEGHLVGVSPIGSDWQLLKVTRHYNRSAFPLLVNAVIATGDDRMAANHVDGFALANDPTHAARMIQIGLAQACKGTTLEAWTPPDRHAPVIEENYLSATRAEYERLVQTEFSHQPIAASPLHRASTKLLIIALAVLTGLMAFAEGTHVTQAVARPGRVTALEVTLNVG